MNHFFIEGGDKKFGQIILKQDEYLGFGYAHIHMRGPYGTPFHIKVTVLCREIEDGNINIPTCKERFGAN